MISGKTFKFLVLVKALQMKIFLYLQPQKGV